MKITKAMILSATLILAATNADASGHCKEVKGRITSQVVGLNFPNGDPCLSPVGICTEGSLTGNLKGPFRFVAANLTPFPNSGATPNVFATTGVLTADAEFCGGDLVFNDTSAFSVVSVSDDGNQAFASLQTVDGAASTGGCQDATGRVRVQGLFNLGCVDCKYEGLICGVEISDNDDDSDSDSDGDSAGDSD